VGSAYVFPASPCPPITVDPNLLPDATAGDPYVIDVTASGGTAPYNFSVSSGTLPLGLSLDPATGRLSGTPEAAGTYRFAIKATDANLCAGSRDYELVVECRTIAVRPANPALPDGAIGAAYAQTFTATGGAAPYAFSVGAGALPGGLSLDPATGELSGSPSESGTFSFRVVATDAAGCSGAQEYVLRVDCAAIALSPSGPRLPRGAVGTAYGGTFSAAGGAEPYTFEVVSGALPDGLALDPATGEVSGTPATAGRFVFAVRATDAGGCAGEREYRIVVD
jgi:hypothetical protein